MSDRAGVYTNLDASTRQIRLVALSPGQWEDTISCSLEVVSLDTPAHYEALSYAWGTAPPSCPIKIDEHTICVTPSLEAVLRRLRKASERCHLWIDQLCIDQEDNEEKSQQVMFMGDIYRQANEVIIWLGEIDQNIDNHVIVEQAKALRTRAQPGETTGPKALVPVREAIELLTQLSEDIHPIQLSHYFEVASTESIKPTPAFLAALEGLTSLVDRSWWQRTWVLQESILAKKAIVVIGSHIVPLEILEKGSSHWQRHQFTCCAQPLDGLPLESRNKLLHVIPILTSQTLGREAYNDGTNQVALIDLMRIFRSREATDDRDKVYGLMSLVNTWLHAQPLTIDYSRTTLGVYADVIINCIEGTRSLFVLTNVRSLRPGFPTWVQDWAAKGDAFKLQRDAFGAAFNASYKASPSVHPSPKTNKDKTILALYGVYVDTVAQLGDCSTAMDWHGIVPTLMHWRKMSGIDEAANGPYIGGGTVQEAFARTLAGDLKFADPNSFERLGKESILDIYSAWWSLCQNSKPGEWMLDGEGDISYFYTRTLPTVCMLRRFYMTSKGYMGIGPLETSVGDQVHVLVGGNMPFLLRHQDREIDPEKPSKVCRYQLVGDCYLHGVMDGEGFMVDSIQPVHLV